MNLPWSGAFWLGVLLQLCADDCDSRTSCSATFACQPPLISVDTVSHTLQHPCASVINSDSLVGECKLWRCSFVVLYRVHVPPMANMAVHEDVDPAAIHSVINTGQRKHAQKS